MNVQIQSVKFDADKKLIEFVENKMSKLERFADRATGAEVILKLDKDFEKGNKVATITLHMPGEDMVAEHRARAFEEAIDERLQRIHLLLHRGDLLSDVRDLLTESGVVVLVRTAPCCRCTTCRERQ